MQTKKKRNRVVALLAGLSWALPAWTADPPPQASSYLPLAVGTFQVRAVNSTGDGPPSTASAAVTPARPPFAAVADDQRVQLTWTAGPANGSPITGYKYRQSADGGTTCDRGWTTATSPLTRNPLVNDTEYTFQMRARNAVGDGPAAMADPPPANRKPVLSGPDSVWFAENGTDTVATYPATDADEDRLRWSLGGVDAAAFEMRGDTLRFQAPPDYERPGDVDGNNVYEVTVSAADGSLSSPPFSVTVSVTDIKEETDLVYLGRRIRSLGGSKHAAARIFTKTVFGTLSCATFTVISRSLHYNYIYNGEREYVDDPWAGWDSFLFGLQVGIAVGFPVGLTAVDPDDSLPRTLLAGVIPAATGYYLLEFADQEEESFLLFAPIILSGAAPVILSLAASELWRNPSEDHRASFGIAPTPKGGLSAVTTLRF